MKGERMRSRGKDELKGKAERRKCTIKTDELKGNEEKRKRSKQVGEVVEGGRR